MWLSICFNTVVLSEAKGKGLIVPAFYVPGILLTVYVIYLKYYSTGCLCCCQRPKETV